MKLLKILLIWWCVPLSLLGQPTSENKRPPNVLFIMVDDLRPELHCYGQTQIHSPNIDRLALQGQKFTRAYVNYPVCGPSRATLLSGLYASKNRFRGWNCSQDLDVPGLVSLPMHFRHNGYHTVSLGKVYNNFEDGQGSWDEIWRPVPTTTPIWDYQSEEGIRIFESLNADRAADIRPRTNRNLPKRGLAFERVNAPDDIYEDGKIATRAVEKLQEFKNEGSPFFLAVGFKKPHLPFNAPAKYWSYYDTMDIQLPENMHPPQDVPEEALHRYSELRAFYNIPDDDPISPDLAEELIRGYYACVSYVDAQIGRVLDGLEHLGLDENTIVVLWGDHGWQLGEHDLWCKHSNFSTSLRIPLIFKIPDQVPGVTRDALVQSIDIFPTLCELAGLNIPVHTQGNSIAPVLLSDAPSPNRYLFSRSNLNGETVISTSHAYTRFFNSDGEMVSEMLYDLRTDPDENFNIVEEEGSEVVVRELSAVLGNHLENRDVIRIK